MRLLQGKRATNKRATRSKPKAISSGRSHKCCKHKEGCPKRRAETGKKPEEYSSSRFTAALGVLQFVDMFHDDEAAEQFIVDARWPDGRDHTSISKEERYRTDQEPREQARSIRRSAEKPIFSNRGEQMTSPNGRAGPTDKGRGPRRIADPDAAPGQKKKDTLSAHNNRNGLDNVGQTPSDTESAAFSQEHLVPVHNNRETPSDRLVTMKEVMARTSMCRGTIDYLMRHGDFPLPVKLGRRIVRWWSSEIDEWMRSRPRAIGDLGKRHSLVENQAQKGQGA